MTLLETPGLNNPDAEISNKEIIIDMINKLGRKVKDP